MINLHLEM